MKTVDHKCPNCNASINYNPKEKNWVCEYCGSKFTLEELKANEKNFESTSVNESKELKKNKKEKEEEIELDEYLCQDCGAKIVADKNTAATFCVYCKNTAILKSRLIQEFEPSQIIPFANTKEDAIEAFKKVGKGRFLMPKEFADPKNIEEIKGIYIPFWLYSCKMHGKVSGVGKRVTSYTSGDYMYRKTDTYHVERSGDFEFDKIPVDGSVRFNDAIMNSIEPFNYKELTKFNYSYLSGFLAEKYDVEQEEAKKITIDRAKETCYSDLSSTVHYTSFMPESKDNEIKDESIEYVLLPVWMVNIKYHEKLYTFAMNGQTGKMIGDIPYSPKKAFIFFTIVFLVIFVIVAILTYLV